MLFFIFNRKLICSFALLYILPITVIHLISNNREFHLCIIGISLCLYRSGNRFIGPILFPVCTHI